MAVPVLRLHDDDEVMVSICDLPSGRSVDLGPDGTLQILEKISSGHKVARVAIAADQPVRKYGEIIGIATESIQKGAWVHSHNLRNPARDSSPDLGSSPTWTAPRQISPFTFEGYRRPDGRVGTRNYVAVISSVNCSATVAHAVAARFTPDRLAEFPNIDGVLAFTHDGGCGMPRHGLQHQILSRVLSGMQSHPNLAACLVIGLGCEQLPAQEIVSLSLPAKTLTAGESSSSRMPVKSDQNQAQILVMQEQGGTRATVNEAERRLLDLLRHANSITRQRVSASHLTVATECGGSDAFSGITANPAVGVAADLIVGNGGTVVLSETPEVAGAEQILLRRAASEHVGKTLLEKLKWWEWYAQIFGAEFDDNPSRGNKAGGLTTITEKSLGAVLKGGSSPLRKVIDYAEPIDEPGLVFMDSPGYDPPSVTGMVAGGATIVLFTTGRGSCFGCKGVPTIKIASNSAIAARLSEDIDLDAGTILDGISHDEMGHEILDAILAVAGGKRTASEKLGYGDYEFMPWSIGPVL